MRVLEQVCVEKFVCTVRAACGTPARAPPDDLSEREPKTSSQQNEKSILYYWECVGGRIRTFVPHGLSRLCGIGVCVWRRIRTFVVPSVWVSRMCGVQPLACCRKIEFVIALSSSVLIQCFFLLPLLPPPAPSLFLYRSTSGKCALPPEPQPCCCC